MLLPAINGGHLQSEGLYTGVGGSPGSLVGTAFSDPGAITSRVFGSESGDFAWRLVAPFGGTPVLGPLVALVGFPQFFIDVVSDVPWTRTITFHYAALPLAALALAMVEGVAMLGRRLGPLARAVAPVIVLGSAIAATLSWGPLTDRQPSTTAAGGRRRSIRGSTQNAPRSPQCPMVHR